MILAINIPCWLIPILTGLLCGILGYLLGRLLAKKWKDKVEQLETDLETCKNARIKLENDLKGVATLTKNNDKLEMEVKSLKAELQSWRDRVSSLEANLKSGHQVKAKLDTNINSLQEKIIQLESNLAISESKLETNDKPKKIGDDIEVWKKRVADLQNELISNKTKTNTLKKELESVKNQVTTTSENTNSLSTGIIFDASLAKTVFGKKIKQDDLTIVEGIGSKIQGLFHEHGIKTWLALSKCTVEKCQEVLDSGGPRYRMHNPRTWVKQAEFAVKGEWEALKKWQDELDGGK